MMIEGAHASVALPAVLSARTNVSFTYRANIFESFVLNFFAIKILSVKVVTVG
jgi:hypothetical protein